MATQFEIRIGNPQQPSVYDSPGTDADACRFDTEAEAQAAAEELRRLGEDWASASMYVVEVNTDV